MTTLREELETCLTTTTFGAGCIRTVAAVKGCSEEEAKNILIDETVKQEEEYQARAQSDMVLTIEMDPELGMLLTRSLASTNRETCGFTPEERRALYGLYDQLCNTLADGDTVRPNGERESA